MYNLKFLCCDSLKTSLEEFGKKETSLEVINKALEILRGVSWNSEGGFFSIDDGMFSDPRIKRLFLSINDLKEKTATAQKGGFESIRLMVESHLIHHLWNHIDFQPKRDDKHAPLCSLVFGGEGKLKKKRGREEFEEGVEPCLSVEIRPRDRDEELRDKWVHCLESIDGWFEDREVSLSDENELKALEFEVRCEDDNSLLSGVEPTKKKARLLSPEGKREGETLISYNRREELSRLKANWVRFKERIQTYPQAELFDKRDEKNRKRQYLEFGCRFAAAFSVLNESEEGEFCFSSISEFIDLCYHGWDVEITLLEKRASNETTFTDPVLRAWKICRDVRRGLVSEAVLRVFRGKRLSDPTKQFVNRHYQSAMELAMNRPFWLGYSKEELSRFEAENSMLCRQIGGRVYRFILEKKEASTVYEILRDEYARMPKEEREALFEEVLDYYSEMIKTNSDLILDPMREEETLMHSLKNCKDRQQIHGIYKQLGNLEVITPSMRHSATLEKTDSELFEEANKFSDTFLTIRAINNRHFLKIRLVEDEIFGAACWAALSKIFSFMTKLDDRSQSVMILKWIISLPFLPKQRDVVIEALKLRKEELGHGAWGDEIRKAIDKKDFRTIATIAKDAPVIYYSLPEAICLGTEEESLQWLERNSPATLSIGELREAIGEAVNRSFLQVLEVLKNDPGVGPLASGGIICLLEKNGDSARVDERISQEDGEEVFKHCVELHVKTKQDPARLINLMARRMCIPINKFSGVVRPDNYKEIRSCLRWIIFESEIKDYSGVSLYLSQYIHSDPVLLSQTWTFVAKKMMEGGCIDSLKKIQIDYLSEDDLIRLIHHPVTNSSKVFLNIFSGFASTSPRVKGIISYYLYKINGPSAISDSVLKDPW